MKKIIGAVLLLSWGLLSPGRSIGQDLLTDPQNQRYLFTAGTDESQAFLYNPAYLGVYSRGSVLDGYYFFPSKTQLSPVGSFHDLGISVQQGKFALAYRNAATNNEALNEYSVGFGVGNRGAALGFSLSYADIAGLGARWFPAVGLIWRPGRYVSFGAAYRNFSDAPFGVHQIEKLTNLGLSIRPFGTELLTLSGDLALPDHHKRGYKAGVTLQLLPGLNI
ncbi:MAG TPA: hypothetical protein PL001_09980, partial [Candidatus Kryptobacter bacterium]|nr:hypothetical protein [Candidatus Kryptobacter bacterium]